MLTPIYHILNGDALREHFPSTIEGKQITFRECLVEGPLQALNQEDFYEKRARFLTSYDTQHDLEFYFQQVVPELEAIRAIPDEAEVNLWFEEDLFCQANMWYTLAELSKKTCHLYWVRPPELTAYGFGRQDQEGLRKDFLDRQAIQHLEAWARLWHHYKNEHWQPSCIRI